MFKSFAAAAAIAISMVPAASFAQVGEANPLAAREAAEAPILSFLRSQQVKLTYLGNEGGVRGYFGESAGGSMQTFYVFPEGDHVVSGTLFGMDGVNVTALQVDAMQLRFEQAAVEAGLGEDMDLEGRSQLSRIPETQDYPDAGRETSPIMDYMRSKGVVFTYLGEDGGLRGYLGKASSDRLQAFYEAPSREHILAGALVNLRGINVTGVQVGEMRDRFEAEAETSDQSMGSASVPEHVSDPHPVSVHTSDTSVPEDVQSPEAALPSLGDKPGMTRIDGAEDAADLVVPEAVEAIEDQSGAPSEAWLNKVPREDFMAAVKETFYFDVGSNSAPITIWKLADPNCPYCHQVWNHLKSAIRARKIKLRIIGIDALPDDTEKMLSVLMSDAPGRVWLATDGGWNPVERPDVDSQRQADAKKYLRANWQFVKKLNITGTPFLAYEDLDGNFYASRGRPDDMGKFFEAAIPLTD